MTMYCSIELSNNNLRNQAQVRNPNFLYNKPLLLKLSLRHARACYGWLRRVCSGIMSFLMTKEVGTIFKIWKM